MTVRGGALGLDDLVRHQPEGGATIATMSGFQPPRLAAFISHSHVDRKFAGQAKAVLRRAGIDAFVAHDDLRSSEEWQRRIRQELRRCSPVPDRER